LSYSSRVWLRWALFALALVTYTLPWMVNPGVSLSLGAYDLAEWSSLHPAVRASSPPFLATFLLRFPLACLGLMAALMPPERRWLRITVSFLIATALLPPVEFFTQYRDDPNYRQQFALALIVLLVCLTAFSNRWARLRSWLCAGAAVAAGVSGLFGLNETYRLMRDFGLSTSLSAWPFVFVGVLLLMPLIGFAKQNRAAFMSHPVPV
jgi:hypothetical protein